MPESFSAKRGEIPVERSVPRDRPVSSKPIAWSKRNRSCRVMTSPSMPTTSVTCVTWRLPSLNRVCWITRSMALATCSRMARIGRSKPARSTIVSTRCRASRGLLACTVEIDPSCPVFIAWSMSSAAASRISPTTIRSGRIRSALRTRSRIVTSPRLSMFGGRASRRRTCCWLSCSSAASSMVMTRSSSGMKEESTFRVVVLPAPVPPETRMLSRPLTQARRKSATGWVSVPKLTRSSSV